MLALESGVLRGSQVTYFDQFHYRGCCQFFDLIANSWSGRCADPKLEDNHYEQRMIAGMVSLVVRRGALTATRQGGGVGAVHGVRFAAAVLKTSAKYLKPRIYLVA